MDPNKHLRAPDGSGARRGACAADHSVASAAVARPARTARKVVREELEAVRRHGSARTSARQHWVLGAQHVRASLGEAAERRSSHAEPGRQSARLGQAPKERQAPTVPGGIPFRAGQRPEAALRARLMRLGPQGEDAAAAVLPITLCRPLQSSAVQRSAVQRSAVQRSAGAQLSDGHARALHRHEVITPRPIAPPRASAIAAVTRLVGVRLHGDCRAGRYGTHDSQMHRHVPTHAGTAVAGAHRVRRRCSGAAVCVCMGTCWREGARKERWGEGLHDAPLGPV